MGTWRRKPPGKTREQVLAFVLERLAAGTPPTVREVQKAVGLRAVQSAQEHLESLVAEGKLIKEEGQARGFRVPGSTRGPSLPVPLLGRVQAGALSTAVEDHEGYVLVEMRRAGQSVRSAERAAETLFALRVRGPSMTGAGIFDGDVVIVRRQPTARSGDIVVALVGDEATVKTLHVRRGHIELRPENPAFVPIAIARPEDLILLGKVIEIRRYLDDDVPQI